MTFKAEWRALRKGCRDHEIDGNEILAPAAVETSSLFAEDDDNDLADCFVMIGACVYDNIHCNRNHLPISADA